MTGLTVAARHSVTWRYTGRATPLGLTVAAVALSTAWTSVTRLDAPDERFVLTLLATAGLAAVLSDPARPVVGASPTALWTRRAMRIAVGALAAGVAWFVLLSAAAWAWTTTAGPTVDELVMLAAVGGTQLAAASSLSGPRNDPEVVAGSLIVALAWHATTWVPQLQRVVHPSSDHPLLWAGVAAAGWAVTAWSARDPARR